MNWTLPLLFILLSPGFLISFGSKCKISIMTILIHALIFTIIINVYVPELEGFATGLCSDGSNPSIGPCANGTQPKIPACDSCCPAVAGTQCPTCPECPTSTECPKPQGFCSII
jgi:hypothetical protein